MNGLRILAALLIGVLSPALWADCKPEKMVKIVYRDESSYVEPGSFISKPKTFYRFGEKYGRIDEEPDEAFGVHGIVIVSEPDVWAINLIGNTGRHRVDPGPSHVFRAPILFGADGMPQELIELEFGCELTFMTQRSADPPAEIERDGTRYLRYEVSVEGRAVELLVDRGTGVPHSLELRNDGELVHRLRYVSYETGLPFDEKLFQPPAGIEYVEVE